MRRFKPPVRRDRVDPGSSGYCRCCRARRFGLPHDSSSDGRSRTVQHYLRLRDCSYQSIRRDRRNPACGLRGVGVFSRLLPCHPRRLRKPNDVDRFRCSGHANGRFHRLADLPSGIRYRRILPILPIVCPDHIHPLYPFRDLETSPLQLVALKPNGSPGRINIRRAGVRFRQGKASIRRLRRRCKIG